MKKSLIALAVAGAFAAPAFAATSNVDVYGLVHGAVSFVNDQASTVNDVQFSSNASRLGVKGSEDLGGGLKAVWQIESSVNLDEKSGTLGGRNSFVGLGGDFGTVILGNHDTPQKLVGRKVELFGDTIGDTRNLLNAVDTRAGNVLAYMSPSINGFSATVAYVNDLTIATPADAKDKEVLNVAATYANGPLYLGASYANGDALGANTDTSYRLAGSYAFGDAKVVAQYDKHDDVFDGWMLGASYKMGPITLAADYVTAEKDVAGAKSSDQWSIGAQYAMSKRTTTYVMYTSLDNEGGFSASLGGGAGSSDSVAPGVAGGEVSGFAVGMIHKF